MPFFELSVRQSGRTSGDWGRACLFLRTFGIPIPGDDVPAPIGIPFALDVITAELPVVFRGDGAVIAFADDFEGDLRACDGAFRDGPLTVADG